MRNCINDPPPPNTVVLAQRVCARPHHRVIPVMRATVEDHGSFWRGWVGVTEIVLWPEELVGWVPLPASLPEIGQP